MLIGCLRENLARHIRSCLAPLCSGRGGHCTCCPRERGDAALTEQREARAGVGAERGPKMMRVRTLATCDHAVAGVRRGGVTPVSVVVARSLVRAPVQGVPSSGSR